jgi:hypothetical protein
MTGGLVFHGRQYTKNGDGMQLRCGEIIAGKYTYLVPTNRTLIGNLREI